MLCIRFDQKQLKFIFAGIVFCDQGSAKKAQARTRLKCFANLLSCSILESLSFYKASASIKY